MEFKRQSRVYYELLRVSNFPHITEDSRKKVLQHYWDHSLTDIQVVAREEHLDRVREDAQKHYVESKAALGFFAQGHAKGMRK